MNLLQEAWIPVRFADGHREWVTPARLSDPTVVAFDADRADFNGALAQFAIGLLQTTSPAKNALQWKRLMDTPPDEATLHAWFEPYAAAFELDGDGPRFMQDLDLRTTDGETVGIGSLLAGSPGKSTIEKNTDHFIKRNLSRSLCPRCAGLALFTKQVTGQAVGTGYRTGLRGGGPLTTLLIATPSTTMRVPLWSTLWLNVVDQTEVCRIGGNEALREIHFTFPWMQSIRRIQKTDDGETTPIQTHPMHVYWGMPGRIRLDFDIVSSGTCDVCAYSSDRLVQQYVTRNYGLNYKGPWRHPLTPHYKHKEGMLPVHAQPGGIGYQHWLGLVLGQDDGRNLTEPAMVVADFFASRAKSKSGLAEFRLWASGYDVKSANTRCWYESTMPVYDLGDCDEASRSVIRETVTILVSGAELAGSYLCTAVKDAWFSRDARGDFSHVDASFWSRTEGDFYRLLQELIAAARSNSSISPEVLSTRWLALLQRHVFALFETEWVGTGMIERQNPARVAKAHEQLRKSLFGPKLRAALALPVEAKPAKAVVKKGVRKTNQGSAPDAPQ